METITIITAFVIILFARLGMRLLIKKPRGRKDEENIREDHKDTA